MDIGELKKKFVEIYGGAVDDLRVFSSPGRVNLIGEHTDYNGGYVFPAALTVSSTVVARKRKDRMVCLAVTDLADRVRASLDNLDKFRKIRWGNYQLGVADELQKAGYELTGCDMLFYDTVPLGAGLSSSAAIEVVTAIALVALSGENRGMDGKIDMIEMARIGQRAENNYVGVNCGIMDQFASAMGRKDHAIFLDCKDLSYKLVYLDMTGYKIVIMNTNKKRSLADSKYNERRSECEKGLDILKQALPGISCLGEISLTQFEEHKGLIEDEVIRKRVEHVIAEDDRVLKSMKALEDGDLYTFGKLMAASHNSLRDLYEVTGKELDTIVLEALKVEGVLGARMTGAGFGGCGVSIVREDAVDELIESVGKNYAEKIGYEATFYICEIGDGGRELEG